MTQPASVLAVNPSLAERAVNRSKLSVPVMLGRRIRLRINPEVFTKQGTSPWAYRRLICHFAKLSFPSVEQAELFCDALIEFCSQFNGRLLSSPASRQEIDSKAVK